MSGAGPSDGQQFISHEAAIWAIRLFLGREPAGDAEIDLHRRHHTLESLRTGFARTSEFQAFLRAIGDKRAYSAPLFLLRPPVDPRIPWRFSPPNLLTPVSQLCTESQVRDPAFTLWRQALDLVPDPHRKTWEFCFIAAALESTGFLRPGARALGFGVGREPLPALFAQRGIRVTATDAPEDVVKGQGWASTGQHAAGLEALERPAILSSARLRAMVAFRPVDMNQIPPELAGYDLCWSSCALEHLGSIEHGLRFVERSLDTLRPGGISVHTTEFNLSSDDETLETPDLSLYRRRDIEALYGRLLDAGHKVWPLNLHPGAGAMDEHIDLPPYALPHLKLHVARYATTSLGLIIQKRH